MLTKLGKCLLDNGATKLEEVSDGANIETLISGNISCSVIGKCFYDNLPVDQRHLLIGKDSVSYMNIEYKFTKVG